MHSVSYTLALTLGSHTLARPPHSAGQSQSTWTTGIMLLRNWTSGWHRIYADTCRCMQTVSVHQMVLIKHADAKKITIINSDSDSDWFFFIPCISFVSYAGNAIAHSLMVLVTSKLDLYELILPDELGMQSFETVQNWQWWYIYYMYYLHICHNLVISYYYQCQILIYFLYLNPNSLTLIC